MTEMTPVSGLIGGALIGASVVLFLACTGRLAGISNMAHGAIEGVLQGRWRDVAWRTTFLAGMILAATVYFQLTGTAPTARPVAPWWVLVGGGLLVGYGTSMGNGCTSGHGVCGLGRLSVRSLVATLTFMGTGGLTVLVVRHILPH
jgi:uncharacterized membrane protein YedE/YeeE